MIPTKFRKEEFSYTEHHARNSDSSEWIRVELLRRLVLKLYCIHESNMLQFNSEKKHTRCPGRGTPSIRMQVGTRIVGTDVYTARVPHMTDKAVFIFSCSRKNL